MLLLPLAVLIPAGLCQIVEDETTPIARLSMAGFFVGAIRRIADSGGADPGPDPLHHAICGDCLGVRGEAPAVVAAVD